MHARIRKQARLSAGYLAPANDTADLVLPPTPRSQRLLQPQYIMENLALFERAPGQAPDDGEDYSSQDARSAEPASVRNPHQRSQLDTAAKPLEDLLKRKAVRPIRVARSESRQHQGGLRKREGVARLPVIQ